VQVTGVQPASGARFVGVAAVVVEDRPPPQPATAAEAGTAAVQAARQIDAETVVFPRRGQSVDQRPADLKRAKAAKKYREHERRREPRR
jgi:hypothetical protein